MQKIKFAKLKTFPAFFLAPALPVLKFSVGEIAQQHINCNSNKYKYNYT